MDPGVGSESPSQSPLQGKRSMEREKEKEREMARIKHFQDAIQSDQVDLNRVRELAFGGLPDAEGVRSTYWKLLLRYLPCDRSLWQSELTRQRSLYNDFVQELSVDPHQGEEAEKANEIDHPLSCASGSKWNEYFKRKQMIVEIEKDVRRTFPHLHFFSNGDSPGISNHHSALRQILFIYAKLNPGISYVQGMNEILGPIYYLFATDPQPEISKHAEADAFFCFTNLMSEIMDNFCKYLDRSEMGIQYLIKKYSALLRHIDSSLWQNLEEKQLNPEFYSFRWLTLLLSQEFDLPDVLRLWDSLFSDPNRFNFLLYVCCALVTNIRTELLTNDFAENLKLLQDYPTPDINYLLKVADDLRKKYPLESVSSLPKS